MVYQGPGMNSEEWVSMSQEVHAMMQVGNLPCNSPVIDLGGFWMHHLCLSACFYQVNYAFAIQKTTQPLQ